MLGPHLPRPGTPTHDYVPDYRQLVTWSTRAGLSSTGQQRRLIAPAEADPTAAAAVHQEAVQLRAAIFEVFTGLARSEPAPSSASAVLQSAYLDALRHAQLGPAPGRLAWLLPEHGPLEQVLWPIACSAVDLAVSGEVARIKQCPGDDGQCGWLFVDTSKSGTRRWCSMAGCGSRVKSRRQAARLRTTITSG